jgi:hypothetical protein
MFNVPDTNIYGFTAVIIIIAYVILAALLWFGAPWLGKKMVRDIPESDLRQPAQIKFEELATLGAALLGFYILSSSIGPMIRGFPEIIKAFTTDKHVYWSMTIQGIVMFLFGLILVIRPYGFAKMLNWLRKKT